jgi:septum formation protein
MTVILASTSRTRRDILRDAGVAHRAVSPSVDEQALKLQYAGLPHNRLAANLARDKALAVSAKNRKDLVVGADQVLVCEGSIFGKPASLNESRTQLLALRDREHMLISCISCCRDRSEIWSCSDTATLRMRNFSGTFLDSYLESEGENVTTSAGGYKLEGIGAQLFEAVAGDHFTILGLPLLPLLSFLRQEGELLQ